MIVFVKGSQFWSHNLSLSNDLILHLQFKAGTEGQEASENWMFMIGMCILLKTSFYFLYACVFPLWGSTLDALQVTITLIILYQWNIGPTNWYWKISNGKLMEICLPYHNASRSSWNLWRNLKLENIGGNIFLYFDVKLTYPPISHQIRQQKDKATKLDIFDLISLISFPWETDTYT